MAKTKFILLLLIIWFTCFNSAQAAGLLVTPNRLDLKTQQNASVQTNFLVKNVSASPQIYQINSDEFVSIIFIQPANFRLEPEESILVTTTITPIISGLISTNISIVAEDLDKRKLNAAAGVKLPLTVAVSENPGNRHPVRPAAILIIFFAAMLMIGAGGIILQKRKQKSFWRKMAKPINLLRPKPWWKKIFD